MAIKAISAKRRKELLSLDDGMAERIKEIMEKQGILDRDLARALDVADRTIYNWKTTGQVSRKLLPLLAEYLNTTTEYLITGVLPDAFQQVTDEENVLQFDRPINPASPLIEQTTGNRSVTRYVGIYEMEEVRAKIKTDPMEWLQTLKSFVEKPESRTSIAITLNPDYLDEPGIPAFIFQYIIDGPTFPRGTFIGYAIDIAPARDQFCIFALRRKGTDYFTFANGFYMTINDRMLASTQMGKTYRHENRGFILRLDKNQNSPDDVHVMPGDFVDWSLDCRLIGVATWSSHWLDPVGMNQHTGIIRRLEQINTGRRIDPIGRRTSEPNPT